MEMRDLLLEARKIEPLLTCYGIGVQDTPNDQVTKAFSGIHIYYLEVQMLLTIAYPAVSGAGFSKFRVLY